MKSINPNRPYSRLEIDKVFTKVKAVMHIEACKIGNGIALYRDIYTGITLRGGEPYDYEHIRSSEEIFTKYRDRLTDGEIAIVVNCIENVGVTLTSINKSKGKHRMEDWMKNHANIIKFGIDKELTLVNLNNADNGIERMAKKFL
ncbi:hypothetical protein [Flavobacterium sp. N1994]|uniref:hypothetical protein n=1 Tax=Flavobacterium sp. N1994 TaxID=2986827 RepID=UPI00222162CC|nr:hypothetical protein [Flavobacterium sp. N1994]